MSTIVSATFLGNATAGADLNTLTPSVGSALVRNGAFASAAAIFRANGSLRAAVGGGAPAMYYSPTTPTGADYSATVPVGVWTVTAGDAVGPCIRMSSSADTCYAWLMVGNVGYQLYRLVAGAATQLGATIGSAPSPGETHTLKVEATGDVITCYKNGTLVLTVTDPSPIAAKGFGGLRIQTLTASDTTGYEADSITVAETVTQATGYTLSPSPSSVVTGSPATITATITGGTSLSASLVITLADDHASSISGTITIANGSTTGTATITPSAVGTHAITATHTGGGFAGGDGSTSFAATLAPITIPVNSAAARQSPGNWSGDTGRGGSSYRRAWPAGAWREYTWTASATPTATLLLSGAGGYTVSYFLNGTTVENVTVPTSGGIAISGIAASASNTLRYYLRTLNSTGLWALTNCVRDDGLTVDGGSSAGTAVAARPWVLLVGDSITQGSLSDLSTDFLAGYAFALDRGLDALGYDCGASACGSTGWLLPYTAGGIPAYYKVASGSYDAANSRWDKIDSGDSLLDSGSKISAFGATGTEPAAIVANYGTNEALGASSTSDLSLSIQGWLAAARAAAPSAWLIVVVPFGLYDSGVFASGATYATTIKNAVAAYRAANPSDARAVILDLGSDLSHSLASSAYGGGVHPNRAGHALAGAEVAAFVASKLAGGASGPVPSIGSPFIRGIA